MRSGQGAELSLSFIKWEQGHCEGRWARGGGPWGLKLSGRGLSWVSTHLASGHLSLLFTGQGT